MRREGASLIRRRVHGAQTLQQLLRLCITCRGRGIQPNQLLRTDASARHLQRQPRQIGLHHLGSAIRRQLRVLIF